MESQDQQKLIDQFLQNELQGQALDEFTKKIKSDPNFAEEVELQRVVTEGIEYQGNKELRHRLKGIHEKVKDSKVEKNKTGKIRILRRLGAVAAIAILLIVAFNIWNSSPTSDDLFSDFYQPYEVQLTSRDDVAESLRTKAEVAYRSRDFKSAIMHLENLKKEGKYDSRFLLGLGNAYLNINGYLNAEENFNEILINKDDLYSDQAKWYLALTYLKAGKYEESKKIIGELATDDGADFQREAKALLEKMK